MSLAISFIVVLCIGASSAYHHHHANSSPLVIKLTHHHIYLNHSHLTERANFDLNASLQRAAYVLSLSSLNNVVVSDITDHKKGGFVAHMQVGSTRTKQTVVMDTASGLLWINCFPCHNRAFDPVFDPAGSTSYAVANCSTNEACRYTGPIRVTQNGDHWEYQARYDDGTTVSGKLATENFRFEDSDHEVSGIVFGCTRQLNKAIPAQGVLGLSQTSFSVLKQKRYSKFGYCISDVSSAGSSNQHSKLILGGTLMSPNLPVNETKLDSTSALKYIIDLEGIYVGSLKLQYDPYLTKRGDDYAGGMLIDTGSTYSFLIGEVYYLLEDAVVDVINKLYNFLAKRNYNHAYEEVPRLCYDGVFIDDLKTFPTIRYMLEGGATMAFNTMNLFQQIDDKTYCLAVLPSVRPLQDSRLSLMGILMQQFYSVGFDTDRSIFMFQRNPDCTH